MVDHVPPSSDPLREPTISARIRAAYQQAGFNRRAWAEALGMSYQGMQLIDEGKSVPQLATLIRMQELIGRYTLDELVHGRNPPASKRGEQPLSDDAIAQLLWQLGCEPEQREAFAEFTSGAGKYDRRTRTLVVEWFERYRSARKDGVPRGAALDLAKDHARAMQNKVDAIAAGVKPVSPAQLAAAAEVVQRIAQRTVALKKRKRKHSRTEALTTAPNKRKRA